jgi:hypothetical protein
VKAKVECEWNDRGERHDLRLVLLDTWTGGDLFDVLTDVRQQLVQDGVEVSLVEFERNLRGEGD